MTVTAAITAAFLTVINSFNVTRPATLKSVPGFYAYQSPYQLYVNGMYTECGLQGSGLAEPAFAEAVTGFYNLQSNGLMDSASHVIAVADFDLSSMQKRLWVIDLAERRVLLNTWVAHGNKSGFDVPDFFSNDNGSNASSLGFYVTAGSYVGTHGISLKLDGVDAGYNDNARKRAIVLHGADYVCQNSINELGRLGRSQGCPAVAREEASAIVNLLKGGNMLYLHKSNYGYQSAYLNEYIAARRAFNMDGGLLAALKK